MNLAFDLKVVRAQLDIPLIYHHMWDVAAGELLLDENISLFDRMKWRVGVESVKTTQGNLRAITTAYGNDYYWPRSQGGSGPNDFGKDNRATIGHLNILTDKSALHYCLAQGEQVLTATGRIPVENVLPGMKVLSFNHQTAAYEYKPVVASFKTSRPGIRRVRITHGAGSLIVTEDHPVWSEDRLAYVPAGSLRPGERLRLDS